MNEKVGGWGEVAEHVLKSLGNEGQGSGGLRHEGQGSGGLGFKGMGCQLNSIDRWSALGAPGAFRSTHATSSCPPLLPRGERAHRRHT